MRKIHTTEDRIQFGNIEANINENNPKCENYQMSDIDILYALSGEVQQPLHWTKKQQNDAIDRAVDSINNAEYVKRELINLLKCYRGDEDAVMKSMSLEDYIQEIISRLN